MVALTFSQFENVAYSLAWPLTLTLMHVLWIGVAVAAVVTFVDRALARGSGDANSPRFRIGKCASPLLAAHGCVGRSRGGFADHIYCRQRFRCRTRNSNIEFDGQVR